jgi:hypothetical protein
MVNKQCIWLFLAILLILPIVSAESIGTFKQGECMSLIQTCGDCTYVNISNVMFPNSEIALGEVEMEKSGTFYNYTFCDTNFTGQYIVNGHGDLGGNDEVWNYKFNITPNGEDTSLGKAIFYIGLLLILVIFLIGTVTLFMENENLLAKVGMLGLGYLLLIAITFIGWSMARDFITSAPFLVEMLRILFFVLIIGLFPLLIGAFAWYIIMITKIKEIQRLMDKGFSEEDAQRRVKNGK